MKETRIKIMLDAVSFKQKPELNDVFIDLIIDRLYREISNY